MCIEKELAANTAALTALTAAISQLIGSLSGSAGCSGDCRDVVVEPSAPAAIPQQTPDPAAPEQPKVAPAPVAPAPAPAPVAPAPAPAPAQVTPAQDGMWYPGGGEIPVTPLSLADVRSVCVRAGQAGLTQDVVDFLAGKGIKLLTELPPAAYPELIAMLAAKGVR